jgi:hypothetical protein
MIMSDLKSPSQTFEDMAACFGAERMIASASALLKGLCPSGPAEMCSGAGPLHDFI